MFAVLMFLAGLVVGWNVLPQPVWAENLYFTVKNTIRRWLESKTDTTDNNP